MRLTDLEPHWLTPDMFIFRNPTGGRDWLTCKRVAMSNNDQHRIVWGDYMDPTTKTEWVGKSVVLTTPDCAWVFNGNDFGTLTVTPSIDASASGNWHGFITNGEIK
jgi:hypothetical protein